MQTRRGSLFEAVANVVIGYGISVAANVLLFPLFGIHASLRTDATIALSFTAVSLARSYLLRRLFNGLSHREQPSYESAPTILSAFARSLNARASRDRV